MKTLKIPDRARVWACIVYPDSAPEGWIEKLREGHIPAFVSPLHDRDLNNGDGHAKKPHWHVMIMYEGVKTRDQFKAFRDSFGGVGCEYVQSPKGYARYLCHLDNPEKQRYDEDDVIEICGSDYHSVINKASDKYDMIDEIMNFISENHITSYKRIMDYSRYHNITWYRFLCDTSSYVIKLYIDDNRREIYSIDR